MKHMDRVERLKEMLLHRARTVAVIGASSRRHSGAVVHYLHRAGYDVIPIRPDRVAVDGLPTYARLEDVGGQIDLVAIFRRPDAVKTHNQRGRIQTDAWRLVAAGHMESRG